MSRQPAQIGEEVVAFCDLDTHDGYVVGVVSAASVDSRENWCLTIQVAESHRGPSDTLEVTGDELVSPAELLERWEAQIELHYRFLGRFDRTQPQEALL